MDSVQGLCQQCPQGAPPGVSDDTVIRLPLGYRSSNMALQAQDGHQFRYRYIADNYRHEPIVPEDQHPTIATSLASITTVTRSDHSTVIALTKSLSEMNVFTQAHVSLLHRLTGSDTLGGVPQPLPVVTSSSPGSDTVVRGNSRAHRDQDTETSKRPKYKTDNINYCWSYGYQVGVDHMSCTTIK
jgi:hypothetical protein